MWYGNEATVAILKYVVYLSIMTDRDWALSFQKKVGSQTKHSINYEIMLRC